MNTRKTLIIFLIVTIVFSLSYLLYAAFRGWVGMDTITLIITVINCIFLILVIHRLKVLERDD
jgi:hypothetical protein